MEYKFTYISIDEEEDTCICYGHNLMDCLSKFYSLYGIRNILLAERLYEK
jgi:hypothetical protein